MSPLRKGQIGINAVYFGILIPDINVGVSIRDGKIHEIKKPRSTEEHLQNGISAIFRENAIISYNN